MAVDQQIDGSQPSSPSRQAESREREGAAGEGTCRRGASAVRAANGCGVSGQPRDGLGVVRDELLRRRNEAPEREEIPSMGSSLLATRR